MAVVKRRPVPKTSDVIERRMQSEEGKNEEVQAVEEVKEQDSSEKDKAIIDITQETNKNYNLAMFQPAISKTTNRSNLKAGVMSLVNSDCGKRVTLSKDLMNKLNNPTKVAISFSEEYIAVGETLPNNNNELTIKLSGKKGVIYSAGIVSEITNKYGLDFNNRTSITFYEVDYIEVNESTIAIINVK